ncbi:MAG: hypothetical protein NBV67_16535, partial [Tagaea sp.]|nr:hypothetical protein [Tagaea sp.]
FARDLTQQVEKYHGKGGELAKQFVTLLADRPDLQREYLGGEVPKAPPIGTFKPGGEEGVKAWIDQDRVANGLKPRYAIPAVARGGENATEQRVSARGLPASKPINLFDLAQEIQGLPEDWAQAQNPPHEPDQPNPRPVDTPVQRTSEKNPDERPEQPLAPTLGEVDPNQMTPVPKPEKPEAPPPPAPAPERRPHADVSDQHLRAMIASARIADRSEDQKMREMNDRHQILQRQVQAARQQAAIDAAQASGAGAATVGSAYLFLKDRFVAPPAGRLSATTLGGLLKGGAAGAASSAGVSLLEDSRGLGELEAELEKLGEELRHQVKTSQDAKARHDELRREEARRRQEER